MNTAQKVSHTLKFFFLALAAVTLLPSRVSAAAGGVQTCTVSTTCEIGEFLYNDDSTPLTGATCVATSKYPDSTSFLSSQAMTGQSDGWYSYSFTAPTTTGLYRTSISCTSSGDTLNIDKTFEVKSAADSAPSADTIAASVWGYSNKTLSGFGTLVSDIWGNLTRTLTSDTTSVTNITNNVTNVAKTVEETRLLIEQIVNKPVIEQVLEEEIPDLGQKLDQTKTAANQIYINNQYLLTQTGSLISKWNLKSEDERLDATNEFSDILDSMITDAGSIKNSWNWEEGENLFFKISDAKDAINNLRSFVKVLASIDKSLGGVSAKIKDTEELVVIWDAKGQEADKLLADWKAAKDPLVLKPKIAGLQRQVVAVNKIPKIASVLKANSLKNSLLRIKGVIDSNKLLLAKGPSGFFTNTWLEEGSIVFKTLATNPSSLISQEVNIKYYLPQEVREEDILETDSGLSVKYDSEKDQYFVSGTFTLAAGATKTFSVRVEDIWANSDEEIASYRRQAEDLFKPLEKTSFFAQGVTLRSDINTSLDKMVTLLAGATTPEQKIRAYREAEIEKKAVKDKLAGMQALVTQAGSVGTLFGFVGGAQTLAVWGLIIVIIAGFVFLTIYMKSIMPNKESKEVSKGPMFPTFWKALAPLVIVAALSSSITGAIVARIVAGNVRNEVVKGVSVTPSPLPSPEPVTDSGTGGLYVVAISDTPTGFLRVRATPGGKEIARVAPGDKLIFVDENDDWYQVELETGEVGWVSKEYSSKE